MFLPKHCHWSSFECCATKSKTYFSFHQLFYNEIKKSYLASLLTKLWSFAFIDNLWAGAALQEAERVCPWRLYVQWKQWSHQPALLSDSSLESQVQGWFHRAVSLTKHTTQGLSEKHKPSLAPVPRTGTPRTSLVFDLFCRLWNWILCDCETSAVTFFFITKVHIKDRTGPKLYPLVLKDSADLSSQGTTTHNGLNRNVPRQRIYQLF